MAGVSKVPRHYLLRKFGETGGEGCTCMVGVGLCVGAIKEDTRLVCSSLIFRDGVTGCGGTLDVSTLSEW